MGENEPNICLGLLGLPALLKLCPDPSCSLTYLEFSLLSGPQFLHLNCVFLTLLEDLLAAQAQRDIAGLCAQHWGLVVTIPASTSPSCSAYPGQRGTVKYPQWGIQQSTQDALGMLELGCCSLSPQDFPSVSISCLKKFPSDLWLS